MKFLNVCHVVVVIGLLSVLGFTECQLLEQQCVNNNGCPSNQACVYLRCVDPCFVVCGSNTNCAASNHIPTCSCLPGYTGDPFIGCTPVSQCGDLEEALCFTQCLLIGTQNCVDGQCVCTAT